MRLSTGIYPFAEKYGDYEAIEKLKGWGFDCIDYGYFKIEDQIPALCDDHVEYATKLRAHAKDGKYVFASIVYARKTGLRNIEIYTPLYNCVYEVFVGLKEGSVLLPAKEYLNDLPVVFYGSSITQGGCASHPGNDYVSILCRKLNVDYVNLGFSGNAKGEPLMAEYLSALKAEIMVLDYDFNAPNIEWLERTHYPLYERIRAAQPNVPIVFMTRPNFLYDPKACKPRREVIYNNYLKAKALGDENVWFINGESLLGKKDWDMCTVDNCHPNDLGFYRMAKKVYPVLKKILSTKGV